MLARRYQCTRSPKSTLTVVLCLLALLFPLPQCYGAEATQAIKTAYLYNFAKFTHWNELPEGSSITFQIIGKHPFGKSLSPIASKQISDHPIQIKTLEDFAPKQAVQILFISRSHEDSFREILEAVAGKQILTVSDIPGFTDNGGMIELLEKGLNIRFRINLEAAQRSGVKLSAQMLRLAESVIRTPSPSREEP